MKITVQIGDCAITVSDADSIEPTTSRHKKQHDRIIETIKAMQIAAIALHTQQMKQND